ncbi:ATP-dependent DNA ligase [Microbacterium gorillae]|uniref:ATP-dependent DNA ligase n=1 Tax=Microbacterium gorillae TaxID=1231063 RepID=UPI00058C38EF|nr:ATP-dependent DNA ligase [Microbacterium gorillae]
MSHDLPAPMLAKSVPTIPDPAKYPGGLSFEPKWDGFRVLASWDGSSVELGSRGAKPLTRYFPELTAALAEILPRPCVIDGEIVVPVQADGRRRLDWEALSARIHPAASRVTLLAAETPALIIAFDLVREGDEDLLAHPFHERRARLERLLADVPAPIRLTRTTTDPALASTWLERFEGAGLDGVVAKPRDAVYEPGKRTMLKIKHARTADVVAIGYRVHKSGTGVGSLLVGLFGADGVLRQVGGVSAFTDVRRRELVTELEPLVERDADGSVATAAGERSRFSAGRDTTFVPLRPERVLEVRYDQLEGARFRHTVQFERWRPDRTPDSCRLEQLERPVAYDVDDVLDGPRHE